MLWLVIAGLLASGVFAIWPKEAAKRLIVLRFNDANEINVGSLVWMQGLDVGYVKAVKVKPDHVEVALEVNRRIKIPNGSEATVLFTGLAGSKSIDIDLPDNPIHSDAKGIISKNPIRLRDVLNAQTEVAQALIGGAENFSTFFGRQKSVEEVQADVKNLKKTLRDAVTDLNDAHDALQGSQKRLAAFTISTRHTFHEFADSSQEVFRVLSSPRAKLFSLHAMRQWQNNLDARAEDFRNLRTSGQITGFNRWMGRIWQREGVFIANVQNVSLTPWADRFCSAIVPFDQATSRFWQSISKPGLENTLHRTQQHIRQFDQTVIRINKSL